ncbi:MAG: A/G-specific adenine glycosylase [Sandaracinaceae bacterium]
MSARHPSSAKLRAELLAWYDAHRRDLPWRRTRDPYAIWVSEVMLQQTRVETVRRYYERFLARFPSPQALAEASEDEVLAAWSGLGYYRRARQLHAGVKDVVSRYGGQVPACREARRALPGVGPYTAGAIGSIAFGRPEPVVDGNVARVLARVFRVETPRGRAATERALWAHAEALVDGERPGDLNQALMELGATVCLPRGAPRCSACPVRDACRARREGRAEELPVRAPKRPPRPVQQAAVVATTRGGTWLLRRTGGLYRGLFAVPTANGRGRQSARTALRAAGLRARLARAPAGELEHVLSHRRLQVEVWRACAAAGEEGADRRCVSADGLADLGISRLTRRILTLAGDAGERGP